MASEVELPSIEPETTTDVGSSTAPHSIVVESVAGEINPANVRTRGRLMTINKAPEKPQEPLSALFASELFEGYVVSDLMAIVRAYVTRTRDEELMLIDQLTLKEGVNSLCKSLKTSADNGLEDNADSNRQRKEVFGVNIPPVRKPTSFLWLLWEASKDFILRILMVAGIVSLILALVFGQRKEIEWVEGAAIFLAVFIVLLVTAGNDWLKERQFASLCKRDEKLASVRREGSLHQIPVEDLLVGDTLSVEMGDEVPTDCLVVSCRNLQIDESSMTGESDAVKKQTYDVCMEQRSELLAEDGHTPLNHHSIKSPVVLSGTTVTSGSAILLVVAVGPNSQAGQLMQKLAVDTDPTPLQNKLNALARDIGNLGFFAAVLMLFVLILQYWIIYATQSEHQDDTPGEIVSAHIEFLVEAITIIVVAVPEGLPLAVTLSLAFSVGRMLKDQNYVRRLAACETMGGANEICSDKTGTLTKNRMAVQAFWNGSKLSGMDGHAVLPHLTEDPSAESSGFGIPQLPKEYLQILIEAICLNSTGYLDKEIIEASGGKSHEIVKHVGSPTECALLQLALDMNFNYVDVRNSLGKEEQIIHRVQFNSDRKLMTTVVQCPDPKTPKLLRVYVKGAAEIVLRLCKMRIDSAAVLRVMDSTQIDRVERQVIDSMASKALRTICIAYRDFDPSVETNWKELAPPQDALPTLTSPRRQSLDVPGGSSHAKSSLKGRQFYNMELGLTCLGIAGMRDPLRDEVPAAVKRCQDAGIRVRMVTGDNIDTAKQIAINCNIYHPETGGIAMTGPEFYEMIGGVVCELCKTESCDCPTSSSSTRIAAATTRRQVTDPSQIEDIQNSKIEVVATTEGILSTDAGSTPQPTPTASPKAGCCSCRGSPKNRTEPTESDTLLSKKIRVDVLGNFEAFTSIAGKLEVLARSQPNDKYALVLGLKALGSVVAVTGDGTNDAPALKKADVGFAMGIAGKEVAKQAADIVLLDDNFESIVKAVKWGRNIYDNIRRFLQFQLTVNVVAVLTAFSGATALRASPLNAVQLLWVNLIMDTFASLALATEPPTEQLLDRPPHSRSEYLVNKMMTRNILGQAAYQLVVMMVLIFTGERWLPERSSSSYAKFNGQWGFSQFSSYGNGHQYVTSGRRFHPFSGVEDYQKTWMVQIGPSRHFTIVFNTFVWLQIFNMINARKINNEWNVFSGAFSNHLWLGIMASISAAQIILVQFGGYALECHLAGLTLEQWGICLALGMGTLIVQLFLHLVPAQKLTFIPQTGSKEVALMGGSTNIALASRGRMSTERLSSRLASGLHNEGRPASSTIVARATTSPRASGRLKNLASLQATQPKAAASLTRASMSGPVRSTQM